MLALVAGLALWTLAAILGEVPVWSTIWRDGLFARSNNAVGMAEGHAATEMKYRVCAMVRNFNQGRDIPEWIEYHLLYGVDHFLIADDCSTDDSLKILEPYYAAGIVTVFPMAFQGDCISHRPNIHHVVTNLVLEAKNACQWMGMWDLDEYIGTSNMTYFRKLREYLETLDPPIARLPMVEIAHHGLEERPLGKLIIDSFFLGGNLSQTVLRKIKHPDGNVTGELWRNPRVFPVKTIARSDIILQWNGSGMTHTPNGYTLNLPLRYSHFADKTDQFAVRTVDPETGKVCVQPRPQDFFLYHYKFRSWREFVASKVSRVHSESGASNSWRHTPRKVWEEANMDFRCTVGDDLKAQMVPLVKEALSKRFPS